MDYELGDDATTATPLGWWSVAFTNGTGTEPIADELVTGDTSVSTAYVTYVDTTGGAWGTNDASGDMYFYGKSAAFQSETVSAAVGADFDIGGDFTYCAWKTITAGPTAVRIVPGDIIRIAKSTDSVSIGNGTWTDCPTTMPSTQGISSSTNASPISIGDAGHGFITGNVVYIKDHSTNSTANGAWIVTRTDANNYTLDGSTGIAVGSGGSAVNVNHKTVKLASATTKTITRCEETWSADNGATVTKNTTDYKSGDASAKIVKAGPANDTLYGHFQIGGGVGVDFSGYQKVGFWLHNLTAIEANDWEICLCSDIAGATPVDTIAIPAIPSTGEWVCLTIVGDNVNLGASIESIALYSGSSAAATTGIYLDNFVACTTSGLCMQSLVSKNSSQQGGTDGFYGIQSISEDGKVIWMDNDTDNEPTDDPVSFGTGYSGTTETVTTYFRNPIQTLMTSTSNAVQEIQDSGTSGNDIEYQGGYNNSNNTQDGETFFDGQNGNGTGLYLSSKDYNIINYLNFYKYENGLRLANSEYNTFIISNVCNNTSVNLNMSGSNANTFTSLQNINNSGNDGMEMSSNCRNNIFTSISSISNNVGRGLDLSGTCDDNKFESLSLISNNGAESMYMSSSRKNKFFIDVITKGEQQGIEMVACSDNEFYNMTISNHDSGISIETDYSDTYFFNCTFSDATKWVGTTNKWSDWYTYSHNYQGVSGDYYIWTDGGTIESDDGADRHTASGICWKMTVDDAGRSSRNPIRLVIAKIAVTANNEVSVKCWMKKSHATDIVGMLVCPKEQIAGVASVVTDTLADNTDYQELELTFTPTEAGSLQIEAHAYYAAGTGESVFCDDMTITQA